MPGYEAVQILGLFAPAKTPAAIVARLNQEIVRVLRNADAEAKQRILNAGVETVASSADEFGAAIRADMVRWGKVIKDAGIRDE